jgi:hypothetical protein
VVDLGVQNLANFRLFGPDRLHRLFASSAKFSCAGRKWIVSGYAGLATGLNGPKRQMLDLGEVGRDCICRLLFGEPHGQITLKQLADGKSGISRVPIRD